ncbi:MAG: hypothetical protein INQ03_14530 [Candidatus Heimdallarchaeota archaeon]|nr:hypothetical protein [Candidatus Heimdallarchaeota archaeon]
MSEINFINVEKSSKVVSEFASKKDKKKAYRLFGIIFILTTAVTVAQYYLLSIL